MAKKITIRKQMNDGSLQSSPLGLVQGSFGHFGPEAFPLRLLTALIDRGYFLVSSLMEVPDGLRV
jgi:hypothetical protein